MLQKLVETENPKNKLAKFTLISSLQTTLYEQFINTQKYLQKL